MLNFQNFLSICIKCLSKQKTFNFPPIIPLKTYLLFMESCPKDHKEMWHEEITRSYNIFIILAILKPTKEPHATNSSKILVNQGKQVHEFEQHY